MRLLYARMLMSSLQLLNRNMSPTETEIRTALAGNLCRCTGYVNIVRAVKTAAERVRDANANACATPTAEALP